VASIVLAYLAGMGVVSLAFFIVGALPEPPWVWGREYRSVVKERDHLRHLVERSVKRIEATDDTLEAASQAFQVTLRRALVAGMDEGELQTVCFELNIAWDDLGGDTKSDKVTALVSYLVRHGRTGELTNYLRIHRPDLWRRTRA
jgi:hypothetical protein